MNLNYELKNYFGNLAQVLIGAYAVHIHNNGFPGMCVY